MKTFLLTLTAIAATLIALVNPSFATHLTAVVVDELDSDNDD